MLNIFKFEFRKWQYFIMKKFKFLQNCHLWTLGNILVVLENFRTYVRIFEHWLKVLFLKFTLNIQQIFIKINNICLIFSNSIFEYGHIWKKNIKYLGRYYSLGTKKQFSGLRKITNLSSNFRTLYKNKIFVFYVFYLSIFSNLKWKNVRFFLLLIIVLFCLLII